MKLLLDENLPRSMVERLRATGHDVVYVADGAPGIRDDEVLALARHEQRVLVTLDRDFGELLFRKRSPPPPSVVYIRQRGSNMRLGVAAAMRFILAVEPGGLDGRFVVITADGIRHRPLPAE